jgi:hypothetical protein
LRKALRASDDPEAIELAEFGLNAVTGDNKAWLTAMLFELGEVNRAAVQRSGTKTLAPLGEFRSRIETDPRVAACHRNPMTVRHEQGVTISDATEMRLVNSDDERLGFARPVLTDESIRDSVVIPRRAYDGLAADLPPYAMLGSRFNDTLFVDIKRLLV